MNDRNDNNEINVMDPGAEEHNSADGYYTDRAVDDIVSGGEDLGYSDLTIEELRDAVSRETEVLEARKNNTEPEKDPRVATGLTDEWTVVQRAIDTAMLQGVDKSVEREVHLTDVEELIPSLDDQLTGMTGATIARPAGATIARPAGTQVSGTQIDGTRVDGTQVAGTQVFGTQVFGTQVDARATTAINAGTVSKATRVTEQADLRTAEAETKKGLSVTAVQDVSPAAEAPVDKEAEEIRKKIKARKKANAARNRRIRRRLKIGVVTLITAIFLFAFSLSGFFTVEYISVRGNSHFSSEEIINIAHAVPGKNLIYDTNKKELEGYLMQNPYIKSATVTRKLPSTLVISVVERSEACFFKYDDDFLVMDDEGILLRKTRTEPKVTHVEGLVVSKIKLGEKVGTKNSKVFDRTLKLIRTMNSADMYFVRIDMTKSDSVTAYIYESLMVKTDYDTLIENLKNGHLHKITEWLFAEGIKRGTITFGEDGTASFEPGI